MKRLALIQLKLEGTDEYVFQRRDESAPTSPGLLSCFGGLIEAGEQPQTAAAREIKEETSLDISTLTIENVARMKLPKGVLDNSDSFELYLFSIVVSDSSFMVYEGRGSEIYSTDALSNRKDLSPTLHIFIERGYF